MCLSAGPSQSANLPASLQTGHTRVHFADSPRNLGITFDDNLSMREQVSQICQNAYLEIRRLLTQTVCVCVQVCTSVSGGDSGLGFWDCGCISPPPPPAPKPSHCYHPLFMCLCSTIDSRINAYVLLLSKTPLPT